MLSLTVLLVGVTIVVGRETETEITCPEAVRRFDECITLGYRARLLKYCLVREADLADEKSCGSCKQLERALYRSCGYRQCTGYNRSRDVTLPPAGNDMAVASDNDLCTKIGADTLEKGGSGVDAAVAVLLCLGAVHPQSSGIGGGGFMVVHSAEKQDKVINFREKAPGAATHDMFVADPTLSAVGGLASGVPGPVAGYFRAHKLFGRLNWPDLFAPSITLLREGIPVSAHMEYALKRMSAVLFEDANARKIFFKDENDHESYLRVGDTFVNPKLADAYQDIADRGLCAFYKGKIAKNIVKATKARGGIMTMKDLADYRPRVEKPLKVEYRSKKLITAPPPASGHVVSLVLQLLDNFNVTAHDSHTWNQILEAFRWGYAMRGLTGDKEFSDQARRVVEKVKDGSWAAEILSQHVKEDGSGFKGPYDDVDSYITGGPIYENFDGTHTTHVSVLGPDGDAVACTDTVNTLFGSNVMTDDGIIMNNQMDDFSTPGTINLFGFPAAPENYIVPGKRPMSSSSPSILFDKEKRARFVTGAAGGSRIITGTILSLINALDRDMTLEDNVNAKRIHDQLNMKTWYEAGADDDLVKELTDLGYNMVRREGPFSYVTSVSNLRGVIEARGEPRKGGTGRIVYQ